MITGLCGADGLLKRGIEFGSHTRTRADLTMLDLCAFEKRNRGDCRTICVRFPDSRIVRIYLRGGLSGTTDSCLAIIAILYAVAWIALLDEGNHQSSGKLLIARAGEVIWRWPRWGNDSGTRGDYNRAPGA